MPNALKELNRYGQSVWLDYIRRSLITSGELRRLLDEDGLRGVTSNPAIFEKAIAGSTDYEGQLKEFAKRKELDAKSAYEILAVRDIQDVADILRRNYEESGKRDGYVSLEVSPDLAIDTLMDARLKASDDAIEQALLKGLMGRVAIANARLTYQRYKDLYLGERWAALAGKGARSQRLLWASTSSKNPNYRDVVYVEELIGPDT